ncbi:MAG: DUF1835 domain-containing protein [Methanobacteriota archaeon]|nr:MAG: DUF1835 domain-containing protein [Euryarchaeota archaeon]
MPGTSDPYAAFRLNLEQQRKRAKDLLRAARAGDAAARRRLADAVALRVPDPVTLKLADAQFAIARELGCGSWRDLRAHVMAQAAAREAIRQSGPVDADMPTLHVRCGSDIKGELEAARFSGDFLAVWDPFPVGPVTDEPDWIARRARFHADTGTASDVDYDAFLAELTDADRRLAASAKSYARVVIWTEHDSHDQLSLIRCLAHYARTRPPRVLELISVNHFPGSRRFTGLGQLPPEAMWLLWNRREVIDPERLSVGAAAWAALTSADPRALAAIARTRTPALPHLGPAVHRHLQELPSSVNGLSLTQSLLLQILAREPASVGDLWRVYQGEREPMPFLGDTMFLHILNQIGHARPAVYEPWVHDPDRPFSDRLAITQTGREVLEGVTDWLSLRPPVRWLGGVRIDPSTPNWRWDEALQDVTMT